MSEIAPRQVIADMIALIEKNAIKQTEERIIALLESLDDEEWMGVNNNIIALIKGETK